MNYKKMKNLFLRQSYLDSWEDYENSLRKPSFIKWDYLLLTASNEEQARTYREQIDYRLAQGLLPAGTHYAVLPDPDGKRVGSGGATFNVLRYIAEQEPAACRFIQGPPDSRHPFRRRQQESAPVLCLREAVFPGSKAAAQRICLHAV